MTEPAGTSPGLPEDTTPATDAPAEAPPLPDESTYLDHDSWAREVIAKLWDKVHHR